MELVEKIKKFESWGRKRFEDASKEYAEDIQEDATSPDPFERIKEMFKDVPSFTSDECDLMIDFGSMFLATQIEKTLALLKEKAETTMEEEEKVTAMVKSMKQAPMIRFFQSNCPL